jgi:hypothetical protein
MNKLEILNKNPLVNNKISNGNTNKDFVNRLKCLITRLESRLYLRATSSVIARFEDQDSTIQQMANTSASDPYCEDNQLIQQS